MINRKFAFTVAAWGAATLLFWPFHGQLEREISTTNPVRHSESAVADATLRNAFDSPARETAVLVIGGLPLRADTDAGRAIVRRLIAPLGAVVHVGAVISSAGSLDTMLVGTSGTTALVLVGLTSDDPALLATLREITAREVAAERGLLPMLTMQWTGQPAVLADLRTESAAAARSAELRALPITFVVAWWAFGSLLSALLAVIVASLVTAVALGAMGALAMVLPPSVMARSLVSLVGLALSIDYLLLMTRTPPVDAEERRAKRTALLAAVIVAAGFVGLMFAPTGELRTTAVTGAFVALLAATAAITLGAGARRLFRRRAGVTAGEAMTQQRTAKDAKDAKDVKEKRDDLDAIRDRWFVWGTTVTRFPLPLAVVSAVPLVLLAMHAWTARLETPLDNWLPPRSESTLALDLLTREHRESIVGTARVLLTLPAGTPVMSPAGWEALKRAAVAFHALPEAGDVHSIATIGTQELVVAQQLFPAGVRQHYVSRDGTIALFDIVPSEARGTRGALKLVSTLRALDAPVVSGVTGSTLSVSGLPAYSMDYQRGTRAALPWVVVATSAATLLALLLAFRAPLVAIKAVTLNLLVAAAALGATVFVFQDGVGVALLGHHAIGSIMPTVPLLAFATTFGMSMDYELFLLNGVRGERGAGHSEDQAIALGLSRSAGLITRAACVMLAVFAAFATSDVLPLAMVGFTLATAVLLDATLVRLVLAPALLSLGGRWNWWPNR